MGHRNTRVCPVSIAVDDRRVVDCTGGSDREHAFIPVDVTGEEQINTTSQHGRLERVANVLLVRCIVSAVHGTMGDCNDPRRLGAVDSREVGGEPLDLLISSDVVEVAAVYLAERTGISDEG